MISFWSPHQISMISCYIILTFKGPAQKQLTTSILLCNMQSCHCTSTSEAQNLLQPEVEHVILSIQSSALAISAILLLMEREIISRLRITKSLLALLSCKFCRFISVIITVLQIQQNRRIRCSFYIRSVVNLAGFLMWLSQAHTFIKNEESDVVFAFLAL